MNNKNRTRAIIPAAGFGTRMNMSTNQSKELLIDSITDEPIIQYSLDICIQYGLEPLVITRKEKKDLIKYCKSKKVKTLIIEPEGEWANTVLFSEKYWYNNNILIFPDTRFNPISIVEQIQTSLELGSRFSFALHKIIDPTKWCIVEPNFITEKPKQSDANLAIGLIGFKNYSGVYLFEGLKNQRKKIFFNDASFQYLDNFKDITRTGKIIEW